MSVLQIRNTLIVLLLLTLLVPSSFGYKKVKCFMPQVPDINLQGMKRVAILDFKATDPGSVDAGKALADLMIEYLLMDNRGITQISGGLFSGNKEGVTLIEGLSTKCFDIVERSRLESVVGELMLGETGLLNENQATQLGEVLGVDFIISGEISAQKTDTKSKETHSTVRDKQKINYTVGCIKRVVTVNASIRVIEAKTGKILDTKRLSNSVEDKWCEDSSNPLRDDGEMAGTCVATLAWNFTNLINPWYVLEEFELEKIKINEFKDEADDAAKAAEEYDLRKSYAIYKKLYDSDPYNPKFLYNMGVLYEVSGDFLRAKEMYDGAAMMKDEKNFKEASQRIGRRANLVEFYSSIDMAIKPIDFEAAAQDNSLFAVKVEMKGKSQERYPVYIAPDKNSDIIANIPGEIQLEVVSEDGDWFHIKLPIGGKEGFVHKDQVK